MGIAGRPERLVPLLGALRALLAPGGAVLCDSIDVNVTSDPRHVAYREANVAAGRAPGQQSLRFAFDGASGPPVEWLHVAPDSLTEAARAAGLATEVLVMLPDGRYLARLAASPSAA